MRRPLIHLVLLIFLGAISLQAYAQGCAMHCDLMHGAMTTPADAPPDSAPCAQAMLCQVASSIPLAMLPSALADVVALGVGSPATLVTVLDDRAVAPLDRPPIRS